MLERDRINYIIVNKKSPMGLDDYTDYIIFLFPIGIIFIGFLMFLSSIHPPIDWSVLAGSLIIICLASFLFYSTKKRLFENNSFETVYLENSLSLQEVADRVTKNFRLKSCVTVAELNTIIAYTKLSAFSWGEKLTLILNQNTMLVNSRPEGQPVTIIKDRKNIEKIKHLFE